MQQYVLPVTALLVMFLHQPAQIVQKPPSYTRGILLKGQPTIVAYAGGAAEQFENSVPAFEQAIQAGVQAVQVDVMSTSDSVAIAHKDMTFQRTTGQSGYVSQMTYEQIDHFQHTVTTEYGEQYHQQPEQQQEKIATFQQIVDVVAQSDVLFFVHLLIPQQEFSQTQQMSGEELAVFEQKERNNRIFKVMKMIELAGLESRTVVQIDRSYWTTIKQRFEQVNFMEPIGQAMERYQQFAKGEFQTQTEEYQQQNQPDVYQTVYNFQTLQDADQDLRQEIIGHIEVKVPGQVELQIEEVSLESWAMQQEDQKPVVQLMNQTYQDMGIPVAYGVVNMKEDYEQALQINANIIFSERPAEMLMEQRIHHRLELSNTLQRYAA